MTSLSTIGFFTFKPTKWQCSECQAVCEPKVEKCKLCFSNNRVHYYCFCGHLPQKANVPCAQCSSIPCPTYKVHSHLLKVLAVSSHPEQASPPFDEKSEPAAWICPECTFVVSAANSSQCSCKLDLEPVYWWNLRLPLTPKPSTIKEDVEFWSLHPLAWICSKCKELHPPEVDLCSCADKVARPARLVCRCLDVALSKHTHQKMAKCARCSYAVTWAYQYTFGYEFVYQNCTKRPDEFGVFKYPCTQVCAACGMNPDLKDCKCRHASYVDLYCWLKPKPSNNQIALETKINLSKPPAVATAKPQIAFFSFSPLPWACSDCQRQFVSIADRCEPCDVDRPKFIVCGCAPNIQESKISLRNGKNLLGRSCKLCRQVFVTCYPVTAVEGYECLRDGVERCEAALFGTNPAGIRGSICSTCGAAFPTSFPNCHCWDGVALDIFPWDVSQGPSQVQPFADTAAIREPKFNQPDSPLPPKGKRKKCEKSVTFEPMCDKGEKWATYQEQLDIALAESLADFEKKKPKQETDSTEEVKSIPVAEKWDHRGEQLIESHITENWPWWCSHCSKLNGRDRKVFAGFGWGASRFQCFYCQEERKGFWSCPRSNCNFVNVVKKFDTKHNGIQEKETEPPPHRCEGKIGPLQTQCPYTTRCIEITYVDYAVDMPLLIEKYLLATWIPRSEWLTRLTPDLSIKDFDRYILSSLDLKLETQTFLDILSNSPSTVFDKLYQVLTLQPVLLSLELALWFYLSTNDMRSQILIHRQAFENETTRHSFWRDWAAMCTLHKNSQRIALLVSLQVVPLRAWWVIDDYLSLGGSAGGAIAFTKLTEKGKILKAY